MSGISYNFRVDDWGDITQAKLATLLVVWTLHPPTYLGTIARERPTTFSLTLLSQRHLGEFLMLCTRKGIKITVVP
ncbi:MAG: hypothetical protein QM758_29815 [Armatimonas sp.]